MPLPRVLEPEVMSTAEEAGEYDEMDFSATDQLFAERAAQLVRGASGLVDLIADLGSGNAKIPLAMCPLLPGATRVCAVEMSPEMLAVAHDSAAQLREALGRLPASQARAVAMAGIYGMTARQVADTEGIPLGTAKTRIRDGLQKLRAAYCPQDVGNE